jgi:inner membrane protein
MSEITNANEQPSKISSFKNSTTLKMFIVGFLVLILLIPLAFIRELIREREKTRNDAVKEINKDWGSNIRIYGPILKVPYNEFSESTETDVKTGKVSKVTYKEVKFAYFFPDQLKMDGKIKGETKKRGIYNTSVYQINSTLSGSFSKPDISRLELNDAQMLWDKSQILIRTSNVKGITQQLKIKLGTETLGFKVAFDEHDSGMDQGDSEDIFDVTSTYFNPNIVFANGQETFEIAYHSNGSERLEMIPIGKETSVHLASNWQDPNFMGEFLPQQKQISKTGFDAHWKVLEMNRPFSQEFKSLPRLNDYSFGVDLMIPVDNYQQNERSAKYGYLVIALTFLLFFLLQTLSKINIHPFQYLLIGLALIIFYTLLLSFSEQVSFNIAYLISGLATVILITLFSKSIMKIWKFPLFILTSLSALYTFIFVIIQLESYALLVGSIGLFIILAAVMYVSRKIEWN